MARKLSIPVESRQCPVCKRQDFKTHEAYYSHMHTLKTKGWCSNPVSKQFRCQACLEYFATKELRKKHQKDCPVLEIRRRNNRRQRAGPVIEDIGPSIPLEDVEGVWT